MGNPTALTVDEQAQVLGGAALGIGRIPAVSRPSRFAATGYGALQLGIKAHTPEGDALFE